MAYIFRIESYPPVGVGINIDLNVVDTWSPTVSATNDVIIESIPIIISGTDDDDQAANLQDLQRMIDDARYYEQEPSAYDGQELWLVWQTADETNSKRRLIRSASIAFDNGPWFNCGEGNMALNIRATLSLGVNGWWERSTSTPVIPSGTIIATMMQPVTVGDIPGDAFARMEKLDIRGKIAAPRKDAYDVYVGMRSTRRHDDLANFVPIWEIEDGAVIAGTDTSAVIEAGASPNAAANNSHETTFATLPAFSGRSVIYFNDVTANFSDNYGRYLVMWRGKTDAGTECTVRVDSVLSGNDILIPGETFEVDSGGDWIVMETGLIVTLPVVIGKTALVVPEEYGFAIYAGRDAGAGSFFTDCLLLIPIDEYFLKYNWPITGLVALPTSAAVRIAIGPDETESALLYDYATTVPRDVTPPVTEGYGMPIGDTEAYFVITEGLNGEHVFTNELFIDIWYIPRYHSLRGAD